MKNLPSLNQPKSGFALALTTLLLLFLLPLQIGSFGGFVLRIAFLYVLVALGLHVLVHWAGQISLGHIAFVALGAHVTARLSSAGRPFWLSLSGGVVSCLAAGLLVGIPALRIRGFYLAILTFALGYAADRWFFRVDWLTGANLGLGGNKLERPELLGVALSESGLYFVILAILVLVAGTLIRMRHSKPGRALIAVRDSEELASSFGINVSGYKVFAFVVASTTAGLGGALWAYSLGVVDETTFPIGLSFLFISLVVIGGPGPIWGTAVVAFSFGVIPPLLGQQVVRWFDVIGPIGLLLVILQYPGGQNEAARELRRRVRGLVVRALPHDPNKETEATPAAPSQLKVEASSLLSREEGEAERGRTRPKAGATALEIENLSVRFRGLQALDKVNLILHQQEVLGLIGPNGAGKSTMLNCISGFLRPQSGQIRVFGNDISRQPSHARARLGIARTFQHLALCLDETVSSNLLIAQHRLATFSLLGGPFGVGTVAASERRLRAQADEMLERLDLGSVADRPVRHLSIGTAKLVELACVLLCDPALLLLDEPSAGLDIEESKRMRKVLLEIHRDRGLSIILVAHDMRLVMAMAQRIYVLNFGRLLAEGEPRQIRQDPAVVEAYLGTRGSHKMTLLRLSRVTAGYGMAPVLSEIDLEVREGEIVALLGMNGSGKSTTLRAISGLVELQSGSILFRDELIDRWSTDRRVALGLVHVPEGRLIFPTLTVAENLRMGAHRFRRDERRVAESLERAYEFFPLFRERHKQPAGTLSGGEQQMLAIARGVASGPVILAIDEASFGLAPSIAEHVFGIISAIHASGISILLVEQNVRRSLEIAQRAYVLEKGRITFAGESQEVRQHPELVELFLGGEAEQGKRAPRQRKRSTARRDKRRTRTER